MKKQYIVVNGRRVRRGRTKRRTCGNSKGTIAAVLLVLACIAMLVWVLPKLPQRPLVEQSQAYEGVMTVWNVEAFEGGSGSRTDWLTYAASKFEQKHKGVYFHIEAISVEQMLQRLADGQAFDMVCFSRGAGAELLPRLAPIATSAELLEGLELSCKINGKTYAVPIFCGAYCLFARSMRLSSERLLDDCLTATYTRRVGKNTFELQPLVCGFTEFNSPLTALAMSGVKGAAQVDVGVSQYEAYERFVADKTAVCLLGTQRDLYRLERKLQAGKIEPLSFAAVGGYTDIVQYVGIASDCGVGRAACEAFVEHLLSTEIQCTLTKISMFSVLSGARLYSTEWYAACEKAIENAYVPNVFADAASVELQRRTAISTLAE